MNKHFNQHNNFINILYYDINFKPFT